MPYDQQYWDDESSQNRFHLPFFFLCVCFIFLQILCLVLDFCLERNTICRCPLLCLIFRSTRFLLALWCIWNCQYKLGSKLLPYFPDIPMSLLIQWQKNKEIRKYRYSVHGELETHCAVMYVTIWPKQNLRSANRCYHAQAFSCRNKAACWELLVIYSHRR